MKWCLKLPVSLTLLVLLTACGQDNKSGKPKGLGGYGGIDMYGAGGQQYQPGMATPTYGQYSVSQAIQENPCVGGGYQNRIQVQVQLTNFPTVIPQNDVYVGVTSFGDVGAIVGTGSGAPTFIGYICPRSMASGQGQLSGISLGSYSNCAFKPISAATMRFPDNTEARFRMMDFGSSAGTKFSYCR